jgi:hypothetical protein
MTTMEPAPEQFAEWLEIAVEKFPERAQSGLIAGEVARLAYAAGADAELKASCEWLSGCGCPIYGRELRAARRPKPPSLKQEALRDLDGMVEAMRITWGFEPGYPTTIRQALDSLPDD